MLTHTEGSCVLGMSSMRTSLALALLIPHRPGPVMKAGWNSDRRRGTHVTGLRFFLLPRAAEITHGTAGERRRGDRLLTAVGDGDEREPRGG